MMSLMLVLAQSALALPSNDPMPDDIVVTANRDSCTVRFADKAMTDGQFDARAAEWKTGKPVRVVSRANADLACVRKIASKLFAKGVTRIEFVDPQGKPSFPFEARAGLPRYGAPATPPVMETGSVRQLEHAFVSRNAAQLILQGRCDDARKMALEQGDLDAAAAIVTICRVPSK